MARAFTAKTIEALKPDPERRQEIPDPGLTGLYLVVQPSGVKSWSVRYRSAGRPRKLTLGRWPVLSLAEARLGASEALAAVEHGRDPGAEKIVERRQRQKQADKNTIDAQLRIYDKRHLSTLRSGQEVKRQLERYALAAWRGREMKTITRREVIDLLDDIVDDGKPTTANRMKAYLSKFFGWCVEREVIDVSPTLGVKAPAKEVKRDRVLSDDELRWFWRACEHAGQPWGPVGQLLLLTGQRLGEVAGMRDTEIQGDTWHLSADRTKNKRPHDVPLTEATQRVLNALERVKSDAGYIHTTTGETPVSGFNSARKTLTRFTQAAADQECGEPVEISRWTLHDLRRTAATGMARLGVPVAVVEEVLNHVSGQRSGVAGIYNRHAYEVEKREALNKWAARVLEVVGG